MALLAANTDTLLYTCPASTVATKDVRFCETGGTAATLRLSKTTGGSIVAGEALLWEFPISANGLVLETKIYMVAGDKLYARASTGNIACNQSGPEDVA